MLLRVEALNESLLDTCQSGKTFQVKYHCQASYI